jgi:hypothetical protein
MKLRGSTSVALALLFAMPACSEEDTVLSINVNLSASELNRQADLWEPIEVEITKGREVKHVSVPLQTADEEIEQFDANGDPVLGDDGKVLTKPASPAVKARFFQRVTLDSSLTGDVTITARATGAYKISETVDGVTLPKSIDGYEFVSGSDASDTADADSDRYTISVRETPTPIEEEGVSAVFLDFRGPGPEPEPPAATGGSGGGGGGGGSDSAGAGGEAPSTGGSGGSATGGSSTGGSDTGNAGEGGATEPGAGGTSDGGTFPSPELVENPRPPAARRSRLPKPAAAAAAAEVSAPPAAFLN